MKKEPTEELVGIQGHRASSTAARVIFPCDGDGVVVDGEDESVGDGDAVGISSEVLVDSLGTTKRRFGIDERVLIA